MSILGEMDRLKGARDTIRTKLVAFGLAATTDTLEALAADVDGIANNGAVSKTLSTSATSYTVPKGYHNGSGTVKITTETKTATPSTGSQSITPSSGKVLSKVTVNAIPAQYKDVTGTDALAVDVLAGKVFVSAESESREGTMPNNGAVSHSLAANGTYAIPEGYHNGEGTVTQSLTNRTSSSLTASGATVSVPAGYYAAAASKSVATATQATPSISIDSAGLITASSTQTAGYVAAGTKSGTKQLTVQAAKTITPSTASQTAVAKNVYTTGAVTVAAIPSSYVKPTATQAATTYGAKTTAQTIAAGTYLSGAQTIAAVTQTNLSADNIIKGVTVTVASNGSNIFSVTGTRELPSATTATAATFKMDYTGGYSYKAATACAAYGAAVKSSTTGYVTLPAGSYRVIGFGDCDFTGTNGFWIAKQGAVSTGLAKGAAINSSYPQQFYIDTTLTLTASTTVTLVMYSATAGYGRRGAAAVFRVS